MTDPLPYQPIKIKTKSNPLDIMIGIAAISTIPGIILSDILLHLIEKTYYKKFELLIEIGVWLWGLWVLSSFGLMFGRLLISLNRGEKTSGWLTLSLSIFILLVIIFTPQIFFRK